MMRDYMAFRVRPKDWFADHCSVRGDLRLDTMLSFSIGKMVLGCLGWAFPCKWRTVRAGSRRASLKARAP
jgi:hypothetical protein